jgi:phosphoglycerate dehydrogenase-like enzyme
MGEAVRELIPLARAFGMRVVAVRRQLDAAGSANSPADHVYAREELGDALAEADYVVIAVPLNEETRGMIGAAELARLRPTAMLVNMARDAVVDEAALYDALQSARIAGAAIDVWSRSPADATTKLLPSPYPFQDLDNVIVTPHVAGWTQGTLEGRWRIIAENVRRLIDGEALLNMIGRGRRVPEP